MECAVNGSLGSTTTAYSFGVRRESFVETTAGMGAGATMGGMTYQSSGTYYYTGTGSVANVTGSATNQSYSYTTGGSMTAFAMNALATGASGSGITGTSTLTTNPTAYGTYGVYGYNGEYTHTSLGLQYLRARYLNVATGTFTSRDTYAGKLQDILSQNRYTYAENNPVGHSDPSGHAVKSGMGAVLSKLKNITSQNLKKIPVNLKPEIVDVKKMVNNLVLRQSQIEGASNDDNSNAKVMTLSYIESTVAEIEKRVCESYDLCLNAIQEKILRERFVSSIGAGEDDIAVIKRGGDYLHWDTSAIAESLTKDKFIKIKTNGETYLIPTTIQGVVDGEKVIYNPSESWAAFGDKGMGLKKDSNNRYIINVGPKLINPNYPDDGKIQYEEIDYWPEVKIVLEHKETEQIEEYLCIVTNIKAHTFNEYPTEAHPVDNGHVASIDMESGWVQCAIAYPNSKNAKYLNEAYAVGFDDASVIEFRGEYVDFNHNEYRLIEVEVMEANK